MKTRVFSGKILLINFKGIGCFRAAWGAKTFLAMALVIDSADFKGFCGFQAIQSLFPVPALPIPIGGE
jgi:hypothetical protein